MADDDGRSETSAEAVEATFRRGVRTWRELAGMSQTELAQRMSERGYPFHQATIYNLEAGRRPTRLAEAVALAEVLGVPLTHLLGPDAQERVARFELANAARRLKELQRRESEVTAELTEARRQRDELAERYHKLMGFTSGKDLVADVEGDQPVIMGGTSGADNG